MTIEQELEQKIDMAEKGRTEWLKLAAEHEIDRDTYVILFPEEETKCNAYVLKYLPDFATARKAKKLLLLSHDKTIANADIKCADTICESVVWSRKQAEELMAYYTMQFFTNNLIIASLDEPKGRKGRNIIGVNGVTEEETVAVGILGIRIKEEQQI